MAARQQRRVVHPKQAAARRKPEPETQEQFPDDLGDEGDGDPSQMTDSEWDEAQAGHATDDDLQDEGEPIDHAEIPAAPDPVEHPRRQRRLQRRLQRPSQAQADDAPDLGPGVGGPRKSKRDLFKEKIKPRLTSAIKQMQIVGNCGNRASYEYTRREAEQVIALIEKAVEALRQSFAPNAKGESVEFDFDNGIE